MMSPEAIQRVQESFAQVAPVADTAAELFYRKLFELDPHLRVLFKGDMRAQGARLMEMIGIAVNGLCDLDALVPTVQALGARHLEYGVKDHHYDTVAEALLWTLGQALGDEFTSECEAAWIEVYGLLTAVMKAGAKVAA